MLKKLILLFSFIFVITFNGNNLFAEKVTIGGMATAKDVWYSLVNGQVKEQAAFDWDISFGTGDRTASVSTNDAKGIELYYAGEDYNEPLDLLQMGDWTRYINSDSTWNLGALNQKVNPQDPFDFGWGRYNVATHNVLGNSVYVIRLANGTYKKLFIDMLAGKERKYQFMYSELDGTNEKIIEVDYSTTKANNLYFDFATENIFEREPESNDWELLFGRYLTYMQEQYYPVTGVRTNGNVLSLRVNYDNQIDPNTKQQAPEFSSLNTKITNIGYDWKIFDGTSYFYENNRAHFVQRYKVVNKENVPDGDLYQLVFTNFIGGQVGEMEFTILNLNAQSITDEDGNKFYMYPNELEKGQNTNLVISSTNNNNYSLYITDIMGNVVYSNNIETVIGLNQINIPYVITSNLSKGMFLVNLVGNKSNHQVKFIVK